MPVTVMGAPSRLRPGGGGGGAQGASVRRRVSTGPPGRARARAAATKLSWLA